MAPSSGRAERPPGRKKKAKSPRRLGGRKEAQLQEPPDHALGRSRGGFGTKIHLVCESHGFIVAIHVTAGQRHESKFFEPTMARRLFHCRPGQRRWPRRLAGDKGYSYPRIRRWLRRHGIRAVIPRRKDQRPGDRRVKFDRETYRRRAVIEQCVGWLKECRAVGTRFDKLAVNYLATLKLAMMQRYLRLLAPEKDPSDRA
jgi:transposase